MEQKSFERTAPKIRKIWFSLNIPKIERIFLAGDANGCMLVVPEALRCTSISGFTKEDFPSITLEPNM